MSKLSEIEKQLELVTELREKALPILGELEVKRSAIRDQLDAALVDAAMGRNGHQVDALRAELVKIDRDIDDQRRLVKAAEDRQGSLRIEEQRLRLAAYEAEFPGQARELEKLAGEYFALREKLHQLTQKYNDLHKIAAQRRISIQAMRSYLKTGQGDLGDLPSIKHLRYNDMGTGITPEQLGGRRPW